MRAEHRLGDASGGTEKCNLGTFGRWAFAEFRDPYAIEQAFAKLVEEAVKS